MMRKLEVVEPATPLPIVANVSRVVTKVVDRITGDRVDFPLLVAAACVEALKNFGIRSQVMYGQAAWIAIMQDNSPAWAGCWGENLHFWVATEFGEVVDLNASVGHRKVGALHSPPILWCAHVPSFYRYLPEGVAELELTSESDLKRFETVLREIGEKCQPSLVGDEPEFPNEPVLCPDRRLLDDSQQTFAHFDRALSVHGIPGAPI